MTLSSNKHDMLIVRFRELARRTIHFFGGVSNRDIEYMYAYRNVVGEKASVLDIGGSESLLPLLLAKRGFSVTVYDYRKYPEKHPNLSSIQGDFLENKLPSQSFDYLVMVSTIEHIGFGSYGAPACVDGDFKAIREAKRLIKKDGKIILTFPFASKEYIVPGFERWYDIQRVKLLFDEFNIISQEYYVPANKIFGRVFKWYPASLEQITKYENVVEKYGCQCNACFTITPIPNSYS